MDDRSHERRADLIAALMTADGLDYADAERVVGEFERDVVCPRCGAVLTDEVGIHVMPRE